MVEFKSNQNTVKLAKRSSLILAAMMMSSVTSGFIVGSWLVC